MALDFLILDEEGRAAMTVAIEPSDHQLLVSLAKSTKATSWGRLQDYYADAEFDGEDVPGLLDDLNKMMSACDVLSIRPCLASLASLCNKAITMKRPIAVFAD